MIIIIDFEKRNLLQANTRSINKTFDQFNIFLDMIKLEPEIMVLSEMWKIQDTHNNNINNYELIYNDTTNNQNDGCIGYTLNK